MSSSLKSPYVYFGGKSKIAKAIWQRLGDVPNFVDPFMGSNAILLKRPADHPYRQRIETVNDAEGMIANFWRAVQADPDAVAKYADWPANENDLHARHIWLVNHKNSLQFSLEGNPDFYDVKIAGWWVWGMALWIGGGFCSGDGPWQSADGQLIHLGDAGQGVQRQLIHLGEQWSNGQGIQASDDIYTWFACLSERLKRVRVCSGDWFRLMGDTVTIFRGVTGVVLDPPYTHEGRNTDVYNHDHVDIAAQVRDWAIEHGDHPLFRIAYCGYEDGYQWPDGWTKLRWKASKGYSGQRKDGINNANREREIVMFSPHCLKVNAQLSLWDT